MPGTTSNIQFAQAGQPATPDAAPDGNQAATTQAQTGAVEVEYVTKAELNDALAEMRKMAQSLTGKAEQRVLKRMDELKAAGIQATPDQVRNLVEATEQDAQAQSPSTKAPARPPAQAAPDVTGDDRHPVLQQADAILEEYGVQINEGDPELAMIDTETKNPAEFLATVRVAARAKAARAKQQNGNPARIPTLTGGSSGGASNTASITRELDGLLRNPTRENMPKIRELQKQLQQLTRK